MLTIKKRYPRRKLFYYGGAGLITGFAGIMALLVHTNANIGQFVSVAPTQPDTEYVAANDKPDAAQETAESAETTGEAVVPTPPQSVPSGTSSPTQSGQTPPQEEPVPTQPDPSEEPTEPEQPAPEPTDPEEETPDDPGIIEEIIDIIVPNP